MIGQTTLLASAFVVPLGMLLACLWPRVLNRMPSLLAFAPIPALVAVLLVADDPADVRFGTLPFDLRARPSRRHAARRCGAVVDRIRGLRFAVSAGPAQPRAIRGVLVDDADRMRRRISGRRHGGLVFSSRAAHARSLRSRRPPRNVPRMARRRDLYRARPAGRILPAHGLRAAGRADPGRQPVDPRRRCGAADLASARSDTCPVDRRPWHEGGPRTISFLDATGLFGCADAGFRGV